MDLTLLDNPGWHAMKDHHRHMTIWGELAARYQPDILMGVAMSEYNTPGFDDLRNLVDINETVGILGGLMPGGTTGWEVVHYGKIPQMVCENLKSTKSIAADRLSVADVPEMLDLVALAQPGPFLPRTIEMGAYYGVRMDGMLVGMAGERLHLNGFCEISAVCTHPDYRGRGFASALTAMVANGILERHETPFLSHAPSNHVARKLYQKLGFVLNQEINLLFIKRVV
ncbi:GNAT family N-acetyltransferase [Chloroflexota bacterium]